MESLSMENISYHNLLGFVTGVSIILTGCLIAYSFQKNLFSKYRNKVKNAIDKENPEK